MQRMRLRGGLSGETAPCKTVDRQWTNTLLRTLWNPRNSYVLCICGPISILCYTLRPLLSAHSLLLVSCDLL